MLNLVSITLIFLSVTTSVYCVPAKQYHGYKVFRCIPRTEEHLILLRQYARFKGNSFWVEPSAGANPVDIQIAPQYQPSFLEEAATKSMRIKVFVEDVQVLIDNEQSSVESRSGYYEGSYGDLPGSSSGASFRRSLSRGASGETSGGSFRRSPGGSFRLSSETNLPGSDFDVRRYNSIEKIYEWLGFIEKTHTDTVERILAGTTFQERQIIGVRLRFGLEKPGIFIEGGMHGREWISPATVLYLIDKLLNSQDPSIRELAEAYDWYIIPVCNPDSYVYSQLYDRLWQKTVSNTGMGNVPPDPDCKGVDLNRNFGYMWQQQQDLDNDPCHERYAGARPFSDIESRGLSEYITSIRGKIFTYLSIHSYSQFLLLPYDYTSEHLDNYHDAFDIGSRALIGLASRFNAQYRIGTRSELTNNIVTGTAMDWVKNHEKVELVYTYKMRNTKRFGFLLPEDYIARNSEEFIASLIAMFERARALNYPKKKETTSCYFSGSGQGSSSSGCEKKKSIFKLPRCFGGGSGR